MATTTQGAGTVPGPAPIGLARDIAHGVVWLAAGPDGADPTSLAWPLGLNAFMCRHGAGPAEVVDTLAALRAAVLAVGGLDPSSEPVPLPVADPTVKAVNGAVYLAGLISRAARATATSTDAIIASALGHLPAGVALSA